jgi:ankyrin repeat protein
MAMSQTVLLLISLTLAPLHHGGPARQGGKESARARLCEMGISFDESEFTRAASIGDTDAIGLFLDAGMDPNVRDDLGFTALVRAAFGEVGPEESYAECIRLLLARGSEVDERDKWGNTALQSAAAFGHVGVLLALLAGGADVNARGAGGSTALMDAAGEGRLQTVKLLLDHGADVKARNDRGRTALTIAIRKNHRGVAALLKRAGAPA